MLVEHEEVAAGQLTGKSGKEERGLGKKSWSRKSR
jgi:hypothetical protein